MEKILPRIFIGLVALPAVFAAQRCSSFPQKGDVPITMSQVREGTPIRERAPAPQPVVAKRALPAVNEQEMEVAVDGGLNYRAKPGLDGRVLGAIPYRSRVTVLDRSASEEMRGVKGKWFKISYRGEMGYVNSKYLREPGESQVIQATQSRSRKKRNSKKKTPEAITNIQR